MILKPQGLHSPCTIQPVSDPSSDPKQFSDGGFGDPPSSRTWGGGSQDCAVAAF